MVGLRAIFETDLCCFVIFESGWPRADHINVAGNLYLLDLRLAFKELAPSLIDDIHVFQ